MFLFLALLATILAFTMSLLAMTRCSFIDVQAEVNQYGFGPKMGVGFRSMQLGGNCYDYPDNANFGSRFKAVRGLSVAAAVLGGLSLVASLVATQMPLGDRWTKALACSLFVCALLEGLTLLVFRSEACTTDALDLFGGSDAVNVGVACTMSRGSRLAIAGTVFWFVGSLLTVFTPGLESSDARQGDSYTSIS